MEDEKGALVVRVGCCDLCKGIIPSEYGLCAEHATELFKNRKALLAEGKQIGVLEIELKLLREEKERIEEYQRSLIYPFKSRLQYCRKRIEELTSKD